MSDKKYNIISENRWETSPKLIMCPYAGGSDQSYRYCLQHEVCEMEI